MDLTGVPAHFHRKFQGTTVDLRFEGLDELPEWLTSVTGLTESSSLANVSYNKCAPIGYGPKS
jgi:hypothetical protein